MPRMLSNVEEIKNYLQNGEYVFASVCLLVG